MSDVGWRDAPNRPYLLLFVFVVILVVVGKVVIVIIILVVIFFHFILIVFFFGYVIEYRIQRDRMRLRHFQFGLTLRAAQDFSLLNFVFVHIDFRGTLWAAEHGTILPF
jgi:hypothetical protein